MRAPLLFLSLFLLSACTDALELPPTTATTRPEVTELQRVVEVRFEPGNSRIGAGERAEIERALADGAAGRGRAVTLLAGRDSLSRRRAEALAEVAAEAGFPVRLEESGDLAPDSLRVVFTRTAVNAPADCPGWVREKSVGDYWVNGVRPGHGCTTARNFAAMLEDPEDLVSPRGTESWRAERATRALAEFDAGAEQELPAVSVGPISGRE